MNADELAAAAREYARRSRVEQGFPEHVEDAPTLARVALILRQAQDERDAQAEARFLARITPDPLGR